MTRSPFMNVLHHAAEQTPGLLQQACAISRRYVLITEDFARASGRTTANGS